MKYIIKIFMSLLLASLFGCAADQVNYLYPEHMHYAQDTVKFKTVLDPEVWEDARMIEFDIPYLSGQVMGVDAGLPVEYRIVSVKCDDAIRESARQFYMYGIEGRIALPCKHTVAQGSVYTFTVEVSNEGGRNKALLQDALTIVME